MQDHSADQLHIEMAHAQHPLSGFAHHGEGLGQNLIKNWTLVLKASSLSQTFLKRSRLGA
ncbi:MAG: Uncharacterised protein [Synechococcus sp. MIT S9220]|nr:MAG: Uncharacterised protein [Synechococcus sp. MIT S9220]